MLLRVTSDRNWHKHPLCISTATEMFMPESNSKSKTENQQNITFALDF